MNEYNRVIYNSLLGLCLVQCYYFEYGIVVFAETVHMIKPLIDMYEEELGDKNINKKPKTPESILILKLF